MALQLGRAPLLKPLVTLAGWTFVQQIWMHVTRINAIGKYGVDMEAANFNNSIKTKVPIEYNQIAENYNHLHEQPTVFYAVTLALAIIGDSHEYTVLAAWGYVGVRILHSLFQSLVNKIMTRFQIFATGSLVLAGLTGRLAQLLF